MLSVVASGDGLRYQWYLESLPISGATSPTVSVAPVSTAHYSVVISNSCGSVTSNTVTVTVCAPAAIVAQPQPVTIVAGETATLSVAANGSAPLGYQWFTGVPPSVTQPVPGGVSATLNVAPSSTTTYWVRVRNNCGQSDSNGVRVTVNPACQPPVITAQPQSIAIVTGWTATLAVTATGTAPFSYQWYAAGTPIAGANAAAISVSPAETTNYTVAVTNSCGAATSTAATVTVTAQCVPAAITQQPQSSTILSGQSATLSVAAAGTATLTYQWLADGVPIPGAVSNAVVVTPSTQTFYSVVVANGCGSVTSNVATVTVLCGDAPVITQQPQSSSILTGQTATLTVVATGTSPLSYQWYAGGNPVAGANSSSLVVAPAATTGYTVTVTNACGAVTSNTATVTVTCPAPAITQQPQSQTISRGASATLSVSASGGGPTYQWYVSDPAGSTYVPAGTGSSIMVAPTGSTATYYAVVTACGSSAQSSVATITTVECSPAPTIAPQPQNATYSAGSSVTFTVVANGTGLTYQWYGADPLGSASTAIAGAVSPTLIITPSYPAAGYFCRISNECGRTVDSAVATATLQCEPTFYQQPQSQKSTNPGQQQIFMAVSAGSDTPVAYQWYSSTDFNFTPIPGATDSSITVTPSQTTYYYCVAKNACGESQSLLATITVCYAPVITQQPPPQTTVTAGSSVTLSVAANSPSGDDLRYQWYLGLFDPQVIPGATSAYLTFNAQFSGEYSVRVTNGCTDTWSGIAEVAVQPAP